MEKQTCKKCGIEKEIKHFSKEKNRPKPRKVCKLCRRQSYAKNLANNPERKKYYAAYKKQYRIDNANILKNSELKVTYGITLNDYNQMLIKQNNKCLICENEFINSKSTHVDHDHKTGVVRGLLCSSCNLGLGYFKDNIISLKNAIKYLS